MFQQHLFWLLLTIACILWYSTITVYVAIKGVSDIKQMLKKLGTGEIKTPVDKTNAR